MHDKPPQHLQRALFSNAAAVPEPDDESGLPTPGEGPYVAGGRAANKPIATLHIVTAAGEVHSFQYIHLDSHSTFINSVITLKFLGMEPVRVIIEGRHLWRLYDTLHQHRLPWLAVAARDLAAEGQPVVSRVTFAKVSEEKD